MEGLLPLQGDGVNCGISSGSYEGGQPTLKLRRASRVGIDNIGVGGGVIEILRYAQNDRVGGRDFLAMTGGKVRMSLGEAKAA